MPKADMPYIKWYPRDWLSDTNVRLLSNEEKGIWTDLINIMATCNPYGHLTGTDGGPMADADACKLVNMPTPEAFRAISYVLITKGVASRTDAGVLFSRRLVRDHERFMQAQKYGLSGGGNPRLHKRGKKPDNPDNPPPESKDQKPEAKAPLIETLKATYKGVFSDAFWTAWEAFRKARIEINKPLTESSEEYNLKICAKRPSQAVSLIELSIARQWQGLNWNWFDKENEKLTKAAKPINSEKPFTPHPED
jgi:hypothetical protein